MLQVEHGVAPLDVLLLVVAGGGVDHGVAPLTGGRGIIVDAAHLSVVDALLRTVVVALGALGYLNAASLTVTAEEGLGGGVDEVDTADVHEIVMEAHHQRVGDGTPYAVLVTPHVVFLAADVDHRL